MSPSPCGCKLAHNVLAAHIRYTQKEEVNVDELFGTGHSTSFFSSLLCMQIGAVSTLLVGWLALHEISRRRKEFLIVSGMVDKVLERLQEQARQNEENIFQSAADSFVFEMDLRDAL